MGSLSRRMPHFYHVQPNPEAYAKVYNEALADVYGDVRRLYSDPHLVHTRATDAILRDIGDEVAHLRLDEQLLQQSDKSWHGKFPERDLVTQRQALLKASKHLQDPGGQLVARYQVNMDKGRLDCSNNPCACTELLKSPAADSDVGVGWTDTNVRAAQDWAVKELSGFRAELKPLSDAAQVRTRQYLDRMGITDRYLGYRNNMGYLGRADQKSRVDEALYNDTRPPMAPRWNLGIEERRAEAVHTTDDIAPEDEECEKLLRMARNCQLRPRQVDPVTAAGIPRAFPGKSEYEDAYIYPPLHDIPTTKFRPPATHRSVSEQPAGIRGRGSEVELSKERGTAWLHHPVNRELFMISACPSGRLWALCRRFGRLWVTTQPVAMATTADAAAAATRKLTWVSMGLSPQGLAWSLASVGRLAGSTLGPGASCVVWCTDASGQLWMSTGPEFPDEGLQTCPQDGTAPIKWFLVCAPMISHLSCGPDGQVWAVFFEKHCLAVRVGISPTCPQGTGWRTSLQGIVSSASIRGAASP
ncbi:Tectonin beta-propeller repeat-containing protein 1 [Sparganum proliferum]